MPFQHPHVHNARWAVISPDLVIKWLARAKNGDIERCLQRFANRPALAKSPKMLPFLAKSDHMSNYWQSLVPHTLTRTNNTIVLISHTPVLTSKLCVIVCHFGQSWELFGSPVPFISITHGSRLGYDWNQHPPPLGAQFTILYPQQQRRNWRTKFSS